MYGYDAFGGSRDALTHQNAGWDSRLRFQTTPEDKTTGAYALGPRMYDPEINRFVGADHYVGSAANLALQLDPLTGNRYMYAGSNPVNLIDDGHAPRYRLKLSRFITYRTVAMEPRVVRDRSGNIIERYYTEVIRLTPLAVYELEPLQRNSRLFGIECENDWCRHVPSWLRNTTNQFADGPARYVVSCLGFGDAARRYAPGFARHLAPRLLARSLGWVPFAIGCAFGSALNSFGVPPTPQGTT